MNMERPLLKDQWRAFHKPKFLMAVVGLGLAGGLVGSLLALIIESGFNITPDSHVAHFLTFGLIWLILKLISCGVRKFFGEGWLYKNGQAR